MKVQLYGGPLDGEIKEFSEGLIYNDMGEIKPWLEFAVAIVDKEDIFKPLVTSITDKSYKKVLYHYNYETRRYEYACQGS